MGNPVGSFIWYELSADDGAAAGAFYAAVAGWRVGEADPAAAADYRFIGRADGGTVGAILHLDDAMRGKGARPAWVPYLAVADVDAAMAAMIADGARVLMDKVTIPQGQFALLADPFGTPIYIMTPVPPPGVEDATSDVFSVSEAGHMRWNELASPDQAGAKAFYARHFGFEFNRSMPMGPMGDYCFIEHHGITLGAIMQQQPDQPPLWLPYIGVASAGAAKQAILDHGGTVARGPHQVPGGEWSLVARDPQGAWFGVVGGA
jgi:predicted enzyme related to lactoylglutathione lyase